MKSFDLTCAILTETFISTMHIEIEKYANKKKGVLKLSYAIATKYLTNVIKMGESKKM